MTFRFFVFLLFLLFLQPANAKKSYYQNNKERLSIFYQALNEERSARDLPPFIQDQKLESKLKPILQNLPQKNPHQLIQLVAESKLPFFALKPMVFNVPPNPSVLLKKIKLDNSVFPHFINPNFTHIALFLSKSTSKKSAWTVILLTPE